MTPNRMTVIVTSPHPAVEDRFYVQWRTGTLCAMTAQQFLKASKSWAYTTERHECIEHWTADSWPELTARLQADPEELEKFASDHHTRAVLGENKLPKPSLRCTKCSHWHDTPCEDNKLPWLRPGSDKVRETAGEEN